MDFDLNEQERMVQSAARDFAMKEVMPRAADIDRTAEFPLDLAREMGRMGYLGLAYPHSYGGAGAGYLGYALVIEQICQASMTVGAIVAVSILSEECLYRYGTEEQKSRYLVPLLKGDMLGCFCFTEPATGSDPKAVTTRARSEGGEYVIEGQKNFISVSPVADIATVFAKDDTGRVSVFIVPARSPQFEIREACQTLGLRGMGTSVVYLDGIRVPEENLLSPQGRGFDIMLEAISMERIGVSAQGVGVGQAALDMSIEYAKHRDAYGKPITEFATIQWLIAEMASRIEAGRWLTYRTASLRDQGQDVKHESSVSKLFCSQMAVEVTRMAMQVHGSYGTIGSMAIERLYRDAKMTEVYVGVSEIQRVIIAKNLVR